MLILALMAGGLAFAEASDEPLAVLAEHAPGHGLDFSPNGELLADISDRLVVRLWDTRTWTVVQEVSDGRAVFSPDGRLLCDRGLLDVSTQQVTKWAPIDRDEAHGAVFSPDGRLLYQWNFVLQDGSGKTWIVVIDTVTGQLTRSGPRLDTAVPLTMAIAPSGGTLALGTFGDNAVWLLNAETGAVTHCLKLRGWCANSVAFLPDGKTLLSAGKGGFIEFWDVLTGKKTLELRLAKRATVNSIAVHPSGRWVATANSLPQVTVWNLDTGASESWNPWPAEQSGRRVVFSPDGKLLAAESYDCHDIRVWRFAR